MSENLTQIEQSTIVDKFNALVEAQLASNELIIPEKVWAKDGNMLCAVTIEAANKYGNRLKVKSVTDPRYAKIVGAYVKTDRRVTPGGILPGRMALYMVKAIRNFTPVVADSSDPTGRRSLTPITIGQPDIRLY